MSLFTKCVNERILGTIFCFRIRVVYELVDLRYVFKQIQVTFLWITWKEDVCSNVGSFVF